jgi:CheY-like chemotaxis protein
MDLNNLHIVIAEDDFDDGEIILDSFLRHVSFAKVNLVKNGKELLEFLETSKNKPDIILTDINMPILNGIDALKEIRDDRELKEIPAFVYSSTNNPIYKAKCVEIGTKGFLVKPMNFKDFYEIPNKIIKILSA